MPQCLSYLTSGTEFKTAKQAPFLTCYTEGPDEKAVRTKTLKMLEIRAEVNARVADQTPPQWFGTFTVILPQVWSFQEAETASLSKASWQKLLWLYKLRRTMQ